MLQCYIASAVLLLERFANFTEDADSMTLTGAILVGSCMNKECPLSGVKTKSGQSLEEGCQKLGLGVCLPPSA